MSVLEWGREFYRGALQLLYPRVCAACGATVTGERDFCDHCLATLTHAPFSSCPRCASTVGQFLDQGPDCVNCRNLKFHFERSIRMGAYDNLLKELIIRMKWSGDETLANMLAPVWADAVLPRVSELAPHFVIPIPLHWRRRWQRGYNQADAFARALADRLNVPCQTRWLRRIRFTPSQTSQTPSGRRSNMLRAFKAKAAPALRNAHVILVDDVMTTGSTCHEAARALREVGVTRVSVAVLAHAAS